MTLLRGNRCTRRHYLLSRFYPVQVRGAAIADSEKRVDGMDNKVNQRTGFYTGSNPSFHLGYSGIHISLTASRSTSFARLKQGAIWVECGKNIPQGYVLAQVRVEARIVP